MGYSCFGHCFHRFPLHTCWIRVLLIICSVLVVQEHFYLLLQRSQGQLLTANITALPTTHFRQSSIPLVPNDGLYKNASVTNTFHDVDRDGPSLALGELPGYTGWSRPTYTDVDEYFVQSIATSSESYSQSIIKSKRLTIILARNAPCAGGALWDTRAYGPSIVPGRVQDFRNGTYEVMFEFWDPGTYTVEIALSYSSPPTFDSFPLIEDHFYEGYQLNGFPLMFQVEANMGVEPSDLMPREAQERDEHLCQSVDLFYAKGSASPYPGRWRIVEKFIGTKVTLQRGKNNSYSERLARKASLAGYQLGKNSLGYAMDYFPVRCKLLSRTQGLKLLSKKHSIVNIVHIGDSNMRLQKELFEKVLNKTLSAGSVIRIHHLPLKGGLEVRLKDTILALEEMRSLDNLYVLFNSGLHDIHRMCDSRFVEKNTTPGNVAPKKITSNVIPPCHERYRQLLMDLGTSA